MKFISEGSVQTVKVFADNFLRPDSVEYYNDKDEVTSSLTY